MKDFNLKIGIAGYGVVGKRRRTYIDQNPYMETICVSDITFENSGAFENGVKYVMHYKDLFKYCQNSLEVFSVEV